MRHFLFALVGALAIAVLPASAGAANDEWRSIGDITPPDALASGFDFEWGADGGAVALFTTETGVEAEQLFQNDRNVRKDFGSPVALGAPKIDPAFDVALDTAGGHPAVAWAEPAGAGSTILAAVRSSTDRRAEPEILARTESQVLDLKIASRNPAITAVWTERSAGGGQEIWVTDRSSNGTVEDPVLLDAGPRFSDLAIATGVDGRAVIVWTDVSGGAWVVRRRAGATDYQEPFVLTDRGSKVVGAKSLLYAGGDTFLVAYAEREGDSAARAVAVRGDFTEFDVEQDVLPAVKGSATVAYVQAGQGVDHRGWVVAWRDSVARGRANIRVATTKSASGDWSVKTVASPGAADDMQLSVAQANVAVAWAERGSRGRVVRSVNANRKGTWTAAADSSVARIGEFDLSPGVGSSHLIAWTRVIRGKAARVEMTVMHRRGFEDAKTIAKLDRAGELPVRPTIERIRNARFGAFWGVEGLGSDRRWWEAAVSDPIV